MTFENVCYALQRQRTIPLLDEADAEAGEEGNNTETQEQVAEVSIHTNLVSIDTNSVSIDTKLV